MAQTTQTKPEIIVKLRIKAGSATPAPPVGSMLAPKGIKLMDFCKQFNDASIKIAAKDTPLTVRVKIAKDKSFKLLINRPPVSWLLLQATKLSKGSGMPNKNKVGVVTHNQLIEIAQQKMQDLNAASVESAVRTISGTAKSMGIEIRGE